MKILGVQPFGHDSSIFMLDTEKKTTNVLTLERFTRKKHDMNYVMSYFADEIQNFNPDIISLGSKECVKSDIYMFKHLQELYELNSRKRKKKLNKSELFKLYKEKINLKYYVKLRDSYSHDDFLEHLKNTFKPQKVVSFDHHECHGYSSLWTSGFNLSEKILVVTIDGQGDNTCATISISNYGVIERKISISNKFSLCLLYSYFTEVAGYNPNADEGKLEALACYYEGSESNTLNQLMNWIQVDASNLQFKLNINGDIKFDSIPYNRKQILNWLKKIKNTIGDKEFSYVIQKLFEEKYLEWIKLAKNKFKINKICLAGGGVANVKLNLRIFEEGGFSEMYVVPAMGDDGVALGAAVKSAIQNDCDVTFLNKNQIPYWGYKTSKYEIDHALDIAKQNNFIVTGPFNDEELTTLVSEKICNNKILAIYRGQAEYGPRALGHRSIIANPADPNAREAINNKFKRREWFQPFCPIFLEEEAGRIFEKFYINKHMTCAFRVKDEYVRYLPSVVHVDNTARAQIINQNDDRFIYDLLIKISKINSYGVLLNTSFNLHGRAMVNTALDAIKDFKDCGLDYLILENYIIGRV